MEEEGAIVVQSTGGSSRPENKKIKTEIGSSVVPSRPSPYDVLIRMPILEDEDDYTQRFYTLKIHADAVDGDEGSIFEVFKGCTPHHNSSFALLGSDLFCFGGRNFDYNWSQPFVCDVYKVSVRDSTGCWIPVRSLISQRMFPHSSVLGGKLYVLGGCPTGVPDTARGGEVYDPMTDSWQALPEPPCHLGCRILSAALENPNRILVASLPEGDRFGSFANFFMYDVQNSSWKMLDPVRRFIHRNCPLGFRGKAVAVGNYLYWVTYNLRLLAYNFDLDLWLTGNLKGRNIKSLKYQKLPDAFFHLENERFCILQHSVDRCHSDPNQHIHCLLFDVSPMPDDKNLHISIVSNSKYKMTYSTEIKDAFLMGK